MGKFIALIATCTAAAIVIYLAFGVVIPVIGLAFVVKSIGRKGHKSVAKRNRKGRKPAARKPARKH